LFNTIISLLILIITDIIQLGGQHTST